MLELIWKMCFSKVHRILVDIVSSSASATPGLGRYPPLKREVFFSVTKTFAKGTLISVEK